MQNDGYQQKCDEVRLLREERDVYISMMNALNKEAFVDSRVPRAVLDGYAIYSRIPVIEVIDVIPKREY